MFDGKNVIFSYLIFFVCFFFDVGQFGVCFHKTKQKAAQIYFFSPTQGPTATKLHNDFI